MTPAAPPASTEVRSRRLSVTPKADDAGRLVYRLRVKNDSKVPWHDVRIVFRLPTGVTAVESSGRPATEGAKLVWRTPAVAEGDRTGATVKLTMTAAEGRAWTTRAVEYEVSYRLAAAAPPRLMLAVAAPPTARPGEPFPMDVRVTNVGDGDAVGCTVYVDELAESGDRLAFEARLPAIHSGQMRPTRVVLTPDHAGPTEWRVTVTVDAGEPVVKVCPVRVAEPGPAAAVKLTVSAVPTVGRAAEVRAEVSNPSAEPLAGGMIAVAVPDVFRPDDGQSTEWRPDPIAPGGTWAGTVRGRWAAPGPGTVRLTATLGDRVLAAAEEAVSVGFATGDDRPAAATGIDRPHVLLSAAGVRFAVPAAVATRAEGLPVRPLPGSPEWVAGVAVAAGGRRPVIDLAGWAGADPEPDEPTPLVLSAGGRPVGVLLAAVSGVTAKLPGEPAADVPALPARVWAAAALTGGDGGEPVVVLDPARLFAEM